jgi:hypothetical protein
MANSDDQDAGREPTAITIGGGSSAAFGGAFNVQTFERLPDESPIYSLVGQVASDWAYLEHTLDLIVWQLAGIDQRKGACITAQVMGHGPRCDTIIALGSIAGLSSHILKRVDALKGRLFATATSRNRIIHDPWIKISETGLAGTSERPGQYKSMARKILKFGADPSQIDDIEKTIAAIRGHRRECSELRNEIIRELEALPGRLT